MKNREILKKICHLRFENISAKKITTAPKVEHDIRVDSIWCDVKWLLVVSIGTCAKHMFLEQIVKNQWIFTKTEKNAQSSSRLKSLAKIYRVPKLTYVILIQKLGLTYFWYASEYEHGSSNRDVESWNCPKIQWMFTFEGFFHPIFLNMRIFPEPVKKNSKNRFIWS